MRSFYTLSLLLTFTINIHSQIVSFEQISPAPPLPPNIADFIGVNYSSVAFIDVDKDNDLDVIICGDRGWYNSFTKLYINNGNGSFTERINAGFDGVRGGSISVGDIDRDNDIDVLITGENNNVGRTAILYKNNGNGTFYKYSSSSFDGVMYSSSDFADVDKDGDLDAIISGFNNNSTRTTKLYLNDGYGNFSLDSNSSFVGVQNGKVKFADVDKDGDPDLFVSGNENLNLYKNNGKGVFTLVTGTPFKGVSRNALAVADIDNDNDLDLLATDAYKAILYKNDGAGNFTLHSSTSVNGVDFGSAVFADLDGDNDVDLVVSGDSDYTDSTKPTSKIYMNDGSGNFTLSSINSLIPLTDCDIAIADVDGDADKDIVISGLNKSCLYINNGMGKFDLATGSVFEGIYYSQVAFADLDGDNDQDILTVGINASNKKSVKTYMNDGFGNYSIQSNALFDGIEAQDALLLDFDNDKDIDIVLVDGMKLYFYSNDGNGKYTLAQAILVYSYGLSGPSIASADIDNDGDSDILLTSLSISELYTNDGKGVFTAVANNPFSSLEYGTIAFADIDGDNDMDAIMAGEGVTELYLNDGKGNFTLQNNSTFPDLTNGAIAFNDIDRDGDQDLILTGTNLSKNAITNLYKNDGKGNFSIIFDSGLDAVTNSSIAFADVDRDRDDDLILSGKNSNGTFTKLYQNDGNGTFKLVNNTPFNSVTHGSIAFADVDGDLDQDVLIAGYGNIGCVTRLYRNTTCTEILRTDKIIACKSYKWIDGKTYTQNNNKATYTKVINNCNTIVYLDLTIKNVNVNASVSLNNNTLTSNLNGTAYQWYNCQTNQAIAGATSKSYTPTTNGTYSLEVTYNGCIAQSICYSNITTATENPKAEGEITVYPNPTRGEINISLGALRHASVMVYSLSGELIYFIDVNNQPSHSFQLDVANGIYFVHVISNNHKKTTKIVVNQ